MLANNGLLPAYVTGFQLDSPILDKVTGLPLAGGIVTFFEDLNRIALKPVYELTGSPPNYNYAQLPNPMFLSAKGTFVDTTGADIAVYAKVTDDFNNPQLYYVTVTNSIGVPQFVRQAWPGTLAEEVEGTAGNNSIDNSIVNSQFGFVSFPSPQTLSVPANATTTFNIAPGWQLVATTVGGLGSIILTQDPLTGVNNIPGQPPYALKVQPTGFITQLLLNQVFTGNPNIFSQDITASGGWVNTTITMAPDSQVNAINYVNSAGLPGTQLLLAANNTGAVTWKTFSSSIQLTMGVNSSAPPIGSTTIQLVLPPTTDTEFTNIQVVPTFNALPVGQAIVYNQQPLIEQAGQLFGFAQPALNYKPINSYLVGWDFSKNPGQLGYNFAANTFPNAINSSMYTWDQTIIYQSIARSVAISDGSSGEIVITTNQITQFALIQYLDFYDVENILSGNVSVNIAGFTSTIPAGTQLGTASLWVGNFASLPVITGAGNPSIVLTLDANGKPATFTQGAASGNPVNWTEITRQNGFSNQFNLGQQKVNTPSQYNDIAINSYGLNNAGVATSETCNYFAIVIGFAPLAANQVITISSISLVPGDIATRPAPKTISQSKLECQRYYWTTFQGGVAPAANLGINMGELQTVLPIVATGPGGGSVNAGFDVYYPVPLRKAPSGGTPLQTFNPKVGAANPTYVVNETNGANQTYAPTIVSSTVNQFLISFNSPSSTSGDVAGVHVVADARLGVI